MRAAMAGHSMEEEARVILKRAVGGMTGPGLWARSRQLFEDGVELELPSRSGDRLPVNFGVADEG